MTLTERLPQIIQTSFGRYKGEIVDWGYSFPRKWNLIWQVSAEPLKNRELLGWGQMADYSNEAVNWMWKVKQIAVTPVEFNSN